MPRAHFVYSSKEDRDQAVQDLVAEWKGISQNNDRPTFVFERRWFFQKKLVYIIWDRWSSIDVHSRELVLSRFGAVACPGKTLLSSDVLLLTYSQAVEDGVEYTLQRNQKWLVKQ